MKISDVSGGFLPRSGSNNTDIEVHTRSALNEKKKEPRPEHCFEAGVKTIRESTADEVHLLRSRQNLINL